MDGIQVKHTIRRKARRSAGAALLAAGALLAGTSLATAQNTLVVAAITTPKGFDGDVFLPGSVETTTNVYEGLTDYGLTKDARGRTVLDASKVVGLTAESWVVAPDAKSVVFKLRNTKSPFGNELTADDLIFGHEKSLSQKRTGVFLRDVASITSVEKVSDKEVRFVLKAPNQAMLKVLQLYAPAIYDSKTVKSNATADDPFGTKWIANNTAGFGSYHVQSVRPGEGMVMVANPNYGGAKPFFDRIVYREVPSPSNRAALVKSGAAQWAEQVPLSAIPDLQKDSNVKVERVTGSGVALGWMNPKYKPFDDVRVRRALIHATDFDAIGKTVFLGLGTRSHSFLSSEMPGYVDTYKYETDYNKAKALLTEAGYPNGVDVTIEYSDLYWWEEAIAIQFQESMKNAGIRVTPKRIPSTELRTRAGPGQRTLPFHTGMTIPFVFDPGYAFYLAQHSTGSSNVVGYNNPKMDAIVEQMIIEQDNAKRMQLIADAQNLYKDEALAIETYYPGAYTVMAPCIEGWVWRPVQQATYFRDLSCKK